MEAHVAGGEAAAESFPAEVHSAVEPEFKEGVKDVGGRGEGGKDQNFRAVSGTLHSFSRTSAELCPTFSWFEYVLDLQYQAGKPP